VEQAAPSSRAVSSSPARPGGAGRAVPLAQVGAGEGGEVRLRIGIAELDRVLGGGLVTGGLVLLGGDPGVGKSTILLMAMHAFARRGIRVLYVSGEESARQVRLRAERLGAVSDELWLLAETGLDAVEAAVEQVKPRVLVLDSVQTLHAPELDGIPGSITQVRQVAAAAMRLAKGRDLATFLVGHVTKEGSLAGPRVLEHLVDTVLYFEGDGSTALRVLRATKNRFGSTGEIGMFEMREEGLAEVPDASARLLQERVADAPGTAVTCALEGSRPLLVEVQALVGRPTQGTPARTAVGLDRGRLAMLLAVLGKAGLDLSDRDVFVSVAGGVRVQEPGADLAVAMALASSALGVPMPAQRVVFGEIGLVGEVRGVPSPALRLREAERHGFRDALVPVSAPRDGGIALRPVRTVAEALAGLR
jgi:DNA repair protein RadA/Sms